MKISATIVTINDENSNKNTDEEIADITSSYTYILGRFAKIASLSHEYLCKHFELLKCHTVQNGFIFMSEHYSQSYVQHDNFLNTRISTTNTDSHSQIAISVAIQICSAMKFCHNNNFAIGSLDLANVLIADKNNCHLAKIQPVHVKLAKFGICYMLGDYYHNVRSGLNAITYQPPEYLLNLLPKNDHSNYYWVDVWSFGIILIELLSGWRLTEILNNRQFVSIIASILHKRKQGSVYADLFDAISSVCPAIEKKRKALDFCHHIIEKCLNINPLDRPTASDLCAQLVSLISEKIQLESTQNYLDENIEDIKARVMNESELEKFGFNNNTLDEMFYLWKLCGSTAENILARKGAVKTHPPLSTLPSLLVDNYQIYGDKEILMSFPPISTFELPMNNLFERLRNIPYNDIFLSFELNKELNEEILKNNGAISTTLNQSLVVKERDIEYQYRRMHFFRRLLVAWPNKADILREQSRIDIPPVYRGQVWAALLGVLSFDVDRRDEMFYELDTLSEQISDRQLQVDIPRCHQYDELMSSPATHYQMKLLLKAILISRKKDEFVYWQGLDSLSAPFLILHLNDLQTAYRSLNAFIDRYLHGFFHKDNTTVIRNYLAEFMRVIEFSDVELFTHLISLDFHPELFAIPWFLTCFAHVLPLHKLFHLWDALLLADAEFPLFIGVAILLQLRPKLITATFNEAILMFSDLPDLHIDNVVNCAKFYYEKWRTEEK